MQFLLSLHPVWLALLATLFTYGMTAAGAALIFIPGRIGSRTMAVALGASAGIMVAASFWSLLAPAIALSQEQSLNPWLKPSLGFVLGGGFLFFLDRLLPHLHPRLKETDSEGLPTRWRRTTLLVLAITLHNFPEGLAVGVSIGAASLQQSSALLGAAIGLAVGLGIQNLPEGLAISLPLRIEGLSRKRSFWYGQLSGVVEPIGGVLGALVVFHVQRLMPYALGFAAGAMLFVVVEELLPEAQHRESSDFATLGFLIGFLLMMILDVAFS